MGVHEQMMRRALVLAARAEGKTSPNPMVGAVLVRKGRIIGEGWHRRAGGPHAEIECLRAAGESPKGATMYVSLEPCCHFGKTPPCSKALIEAGVAEVFYAVPDDNPKVSGGGHQQLVEAGIRTVKGPLEAQGRFLNRAFFRFITSARAHVTAKYAMTLDGRIATVTGESQWITGPRARQQGHLLRHLSDAVLVGSGTVLADNPRLTTRLEGEPEPAHPLRVVLDGRGRVPLEAALFQPDLPGNTLVMTTHLMGSSHREALLQRGVWVDEIEADERGRPQLGKVLEQLARRDIVRLMVEGGAEVLGGLLDLGLIDEVWAFMGPKLVGGSKAPGPFGGQGIAKIDRALHLNLYETLELGGDLLLKGTVEPKG